MAAYPGNGEAIGDRRGWDTHSVGFGVRRRGDEVGMRPTIRAPMRRAWCEGPSRGWRWRCQRWRRPQRWSWRGGPASSRRPGSPRPGPSEASSRTEPAAWTSRSRSCLRTGWRERSAGSAWRRASKATGPGTPRPKPCVLAPRRGMDADCEVERPLVGDGAVTATVAADILAPLLSETTSKPSPPRGPRARARARTRPRAEEPGSTDLWSRRPGKKQSRMSTNGLR